MTYAAPDEMVISRASLPSSLGSRSATPMYGRWTASGSTKQPIKSMPGEDSAGAMMPPSITMRPKTARWQRHQSQTAIAVDH
jgi:hypothetical protein